jgi:4a-hydroxytetrahydrobiopterin dehydratase
MPMSPAADGRSSPLLAAEAVQVRLASRLPQWRLQGDALCRRVRTGGWKATLMVVNTIGHLAEAAWHHPELQVSYAQVDIALSTHEAGGITEKDLALAERIEAVLMWRPGAEPGAVLSGTPDEPAHRYIVYD